MIERILSAVVVLFPVSEIAMAFLKRSRRGSARDEDRGSMALVWVGVCLGVIAALAAARVDSTRIRGAPAALHAAALLLLVGGLVLRWMAILTLGKFFTVNVAIHADHAVVDRGPYRFMRHPSYTGLMVAFVGLGLYFENWLCPIVLLVVIVPALVNRVHKEERALLRSLGPAYATYSARTKRFLPGLF